MFRLINFSLSLIETNIKFQVVWAWKTTYFYYDYFLFSVIITITSMQPIQCDLF